MTLLKNYADTKEIFLKNLKGKSLTYKRYTKSPLRYGGGKSLAVGMIIENFPNNVKRVVSPFIGGGKFRGSVCFGIKFRGFSL